MLHDLPRSWCAGSEPTLGPTEANHLTEIQSIGKRTCTTPHPPTQPFFPLTEVHLGIGSVILIFSTLGISRSCAATLAYLMHQNEQTLKVCIPWSRLDHSCLHEVASELYWGEADPAQGPNWGRVRVGGFKSTTSKGKIPTVWARGLRLGKWGRPRDSGCTRLQLAAPSACPPLPLVCPLGFVHGSPGDMHFCRCLESLKCSAGRALVGTRSNDSFTLGGAGLREEKEVGTHHNKPRGYSGLLTPGAVLSHCPLP